MKLMIVLVLVISNVQHLYAQYCHNYDPFYEFDIFHAAMDEFNKCIFNISIMNTTCIDTHCPQIRTSGICPLDSNKQLASKKVKEINNILMTCFSEAKNICGFPVTNIPLPIVTVDLAEALYKIPFVAIHCTSYHDKTRWIINNFTGAKFKISNTYSQNNSSYIQVNTKIMDMHYLGRTKCHIFIENPFNSFDSFITNLFKQFSKPILKIINAGISWIRPDVEFQYRVNMITSISVNVNKVHTQPIARSKIEVKFILTKLFPLDADKWFLDLNPLLIITKGIKNTWEEGTLPGIFSKFLGTYVAYGLKVAIENCPE